jgi:hypothetical protein
MKAEKILAGILIHMILIPVWCAFIFAIWDRQLVIALLCPLCFGACKGMWHIEIVMGGTSGEDYSGR